MIENSLIDTARLLVADKKGLLAMDESISACNKRFAVAAAQQAVAHRAACNAAARTGRYDAATERTAA